MSHAPIALFAFRRPTHTSRVLESLAQNAEAHESDLIVFLDGPRDQRDEPLVDAVRAVVEQAVGFRSVQVRRAPRNLGLSRSLTTGVSTVLREHPRVIVLEDDIVVSPHFLRFMNEHLRLYEHDDQVASIHGAVYPHDRRLPPTFFIRGADCWGWATWSRAWTHLNLAGAELLEELRTRNLTSAFDFDGSAHFTEMLEDQVAGRNDSWAVRWHASTFLAGMLTLYPDQPMARNIGDDGSGTHGGVRGVSEPEPWGEPITASRIPLVESDEGRRAFAEYFSSRSAFGPSPLGRSLRRALRPWWLRLPRSARSRISRAMRR